MRKHLASLLALIGKLGGLFLKLLKSAKFIKIGLAGASLAAYSWMFSPQFALILIIALVIHEYGHLRAMHACGIPTKGIFLIPFFGGAAVAEKDFASRGDESYTAMMGPAWGLGTAIIPGLICLAYPHPALAGVASFIALLNLFNLLPVNPLDGGRVIKSIAFSLDTRLGLAVLMFGMLGIFAGMLFMNIGLFLLIGFIAATELSAEWLALQRAIQRANYEEFLRTLHPEAQEVMLQIGALTMHPTTIKIKPVMSSRQIAIHLVCYVGLLFSFLAVIRLSAEVKGADVAFKALAEGH